MKIDFAFICDYAEAREKVNALGIGFERVIAAKVPVKHPHFSVVVQVKFTRTEGGNKDDRSTLPMRTARMLSRSSTARLSLAPPRPESWKTPPAWSWSSIT